MKEASRMAEEAGRAAQGRPFAGVVHSLGTLIPSARTTDEGLDANFASSFLSRFAIHSRIALADGARTVVIAASARQVPSYASNEFRDVAGVGTGMSAHGAAQLANDIWAARMNRTGSPAWGYGPGAVDTDIRRELPAVVRYGLAPFFAPWTRSADQAAADVARLLLDEGLGEGGFADRNGPFGASDFVLDAERQERLVALAQEMVDVALAKFA
ncbi:hypothetical protein DFJ74DRAFT_408179 [Hyaloraphidium curvatum]|nr:hypothetical protein DFJ74DRAFT_408179 [Hyaloraphidium curvatum]